MTVSRQREAELSVEILRPGHGLDEITGAWRDLAGRAGNAFVGPEWFEACRLARGGDLAVVAIARDSTVVGVVPVEIERRLVRFAGASLGDHFAPAAAPDDLEHVAGAVAAALTDQIPGRQVVLDRVDVDALWVRSFARGRPPRTARTRLRREALPYLDLRGNTWQTWLAGRSRNFRGQVGRKERALLRDHDAVYRAADTTSLDEDLETFFRLHAARWSVRAGESALLDDTAREFHRHFAGALAREGRLRLWFLEIGGDAVAAVYGWSVGGRWSYFNSGWDPAWAPGSVGFVLLAHCVREAFAEGADTFDLLLGDEAYKERFASGERFVETISLARPTSRAHVAARGEAGVRRALAAMPPALDERLRRGIATVRGLVR